MANKIVIAELDIEASALLKNTTALKKQIQDLKDEQKALQVVGQENSDLYVQNAVDIKALTSAYNTNVKALSESSKATQDQATRLTLIDEVLNKEITTIREAREQNALLNKLRNDANLTTAEGIAEVERLNNALDANNAFIQDNADAYLKQKINVGNYTESIKEALGEMNLLNGGLGGFISRSQEAGGVGNLLNNSLKGATTGMMGMVKASLAFIATPLGAILAVLVGAFALVKSALDRSETATNKLKVAFASVTGIINTVLKALQPLGEFLIDGIVKGFELAGEVAEKTMGLLADGLALIGFDSASESVKEWTNEIKEGVKSAQELAKAEAELEESQRKARLTQLEYQKTAEKFRQIRDDENRSIAERIQANEQLGQVLKQQLKDELLIAEQALKVANLRIQAEGRTKEALDAQAQALTEIADIQERITGQESEQLTNRVSLQKEANDKAKELREKRTAEELEASKQRIDLFIAEQGFRKKSTEEEYLFNKDLQEKELKDLELRYKKGKVSKLEYETEKLNISNDFLKKNADLLISEGERELEIIKNNSKLGLDAKLEAERVYQDLRLEQGIINEREYQDAIKLIEDEYTQQKLDKKLADEQLERDRQAINLENQRELNQVTFEQDIELQKAQNEIKLQEELLNAEKTGADMSLIRAKYADYDAKLTEMVEAKKRADMAQTFGNLATLYGEASAIGKAFSIAQATVSGYEAVLNAYKTAQNSPITALVPAYPAIQAGIAGIFSAKQISGIAGVKFEKGGIQEIGGKRHSQGGTKFYGEDGTAFEAEKGEGIGILNRNAYSSFMDFNNRFGSGSSSSGFFQGGGIITQGVREQTINIESVVDAIQGMPAPRVAVDEIQTVGNRYAKVVNSADLG